MPEKGDCHRDIFQSAKWVYLEIKPGHAAEARDMSSSVDSIAEDSVQGRRAGSFCAHMMAHG